SLQLVARDPIKNKMGPTRKMAAHVFGQQAGGDKIWYELAGGHDCRDAPTQLVILPCARAKQRSLISTKDIAIRVRRREMADEKIGLRTLSGARDAKKDDGL